MRDQLIKYSAIFAKVSAMQRNLLNIQDYSDLLSKNTVNEIAAYLKNNTNYKKVLSNVTESNIHRGELEKLLTRSFEQEFIRLNNFLNANEKRFMRIFIIGNEIELLKKMLRKLITKELSSIDLDINPKFLKYYTIDPQKLVESTSKQQFIDNLKDTDYYLILTQFLTDGEDLEIFKLEMALDVYYYKKAWQLSQKLLQKQDKTIISHTLGMEIDMLNIMWIIRAKRYFNLDSEIIYSFILPLNFRFKKSELIEMVESPNVEAALKVLSKTKYADVFSDMNMYIEIYYSKQVLITMQKEKSLNPFSIASILSYVHFKTIEINNIIKIIEGIRYNVDKNDIKSYMALTGGVNIGS